MDQQHTRNFSIIAHVDHGKSTLADRFIQICGGLTEREMAEQVLKELLPYEVEVAIATRAAEKKLRTMKTGGKTTGSDVGAKSRERVYRYLRSRGYTTRVISLAMAGFTFEEDPP